MPPPPRELWVWCPRGCSWVPRGYSGTPRAVRLPARQNTWEELKNTQGGHSTHNSQGWGGIMALLHGLLLIKHVLWLWYNGKLTLRTWRGGLGRCDPHSIVRGVHRTDYDRCGGPGWTRITISMRPRHKRVTKSLRSPLPGRYTSQPCDKILAPPAPRSEAWRPPSPGRSWVCSPWSLYSKPCDNGHYSYKFADNYHFLQRPLGTLTAVNHCNCL